MLLVGRHEGHTACKKNEWLGAGVVICPERGADLHTAQLMPLPLIVSCFSKIQIGFTFLVLAHLGSPEARDSEWQWHQLGHMQVCTSLAPRSRQITTPVPHHSFFTGCMPFLLPNQQRQSTEGMPNN